MNTMAYIAGLVAADGNVAADEPYFYVSSKEKSDLENFVAPLVERILGRKATLFYDRCASVYKLKVYSRNLWTRLVQDYKIPPGEKASIITPPTFLNADDEAAYIRGWFDGEGWCETLIVRSLHHVYKYPRIGFKVKSLAIRDYIWLVLYKLDVKPSCYSRADGSFGIWINGVTRCRGFREKIGFGYPSKRRALERLLDECVY